MRARASMVRGRARRGYLVEIQGQEVLVGAPRVRVRVGVG